MAERGVLRSMVAPTLAAGVLALSLTILFLSMRAVMEVGGACASGGPYEIAQPCPKGVGWMMPVSIFAGMGSALALALTAGTGPKLWTLAWPALFLSLGWNFLEYGLDPPGTAGNSPGFLVCAVVFALMGGAPLVVLLRVGARATFWGAPTTDRRARLERSTLLSSLLAAVALGIVLGVRVVDAAG
jgi:hypothetical protein